MKKLTILLTLISASLLLFSCKSTPKTQEIELPPQPYLSRKLMDKGQLNAGQLTRYFLSKRPNADVNEILNMAANYIAEANDEGINSDVAFAQMCLETGYLKFGNLVKASMNNFCGLGAIDKDNPGESFPTKLLGIRAHIQHLHAYATDEDVKLNNELVDPRYDWPHKTKHADTIQDLTGNWASDPEYDQKIEKILCEMELLFPKN
ncbi:MAG: glucosaminidase domain-containing protein [Treponema sp.]|nr:glucosaminidase domain-containing protein [Treponema sp.]